MSASEAPGLAEKDADSLKTIGAKCVGVATEGANHPSHGNNPRLTSWRKPSENTYGRR
jgi:hypothetical protein